MWCTVVPVACPQFKHCVWTDSDERNGPKLNPEQPKVVLRPHRCTSEDSSARLGKRFFLPALCRFVVPGSLCWGPLNLTWKGFSPQSWVKNTEQTFLAAFTCSHLSQRYVPINQYGWQGRSYRINVARCNEPWIRFRLNMLIETLLQKTPKRMKYEVTSPTEKQYGLWPIPLGNHCCVMYGCSSYLL